MPGTRRNRPESNLDALRLPKDCDVKDPTKGRDISCGTRAWPIELASLGFGAGGAQDLCDAAGTGGDLSGVDGCGLRGASACYSYYRSLSLTVFADI